MSIRTRARNGIVVAALSLGASPAFAQFSGYYRITPRHSGKAVAVQSASTADGANVFQWTYGGTATNDEWQVSSIGVGYWRIINRHSGKDLVVQSASTAEGANIFQYAYGGTNTNDEWSIVDVGLGYHRITSRHSGKSAEVVGGSVTDGANVAQRTYSGATYQQFQLTSVGASTPPTPTPTPGGTLPTPTPTPTPTPPSSGSCVRTVNVASSSALSSAAANAAAGDCIVVASGSYSGFTVTADGTSASPIIIRAASRGGATISSGGIFLNGASWVTIEGFRVTSHSSRSVDSTTRRLGIGLQNSNNCRITRNWINLASPPADTHWVGLGGNSNNNQVDHNEFGPFSGSGKQVYVYPAGNPRISGVTPPSDRSSWANGSGPYNPNMARNTRIHRNYFRNKAGGTSEAIILGGIGVTGDYQNTGSIVEYNLFQDCDGDAENISVKASNTIIRYNTIRRSSGMISLRAGNSSQIYNNLILQGGDSGTGGIKVYEKNHRVNNNYVDGATDYPYLLGAGDPYNSSTFAHARADGVIMDNNIAVNNNTRGAIIGHGGSLAPSNCSFSYNALRGSAATVILRNPGNTRLAGNSTSGSNPPMPGTPLTTSNVGPNAP